MEWDLLENISNNKETNMKKQWKSILDFDYGFVFMTFDVKNDDAVQSGCSAKWLFCMGPEKRRNCKNAHKNLNSTIKQF